MSDLDYLLIYILGIILLYIVYHIVMSVKSDIAKHDTLYEDIENDEEFVRIVENDNYHNNNNVEYSSDEIEQKPLKKDIIIKYPPAIPLKYKLYPLDIFKHQLSKELYQDVVIDRLWIYEPFHTLFVKVILLVEAYGHKGIKNQYSKTIKTKEGDDIVYSFKAYNLYEITLITARRIYFNFEIEKSDDELMQNILIATLLKQIVIINEAQYSIHGKDIYKYLKANLLNKYSYTQQIISFLNDNWIDSNQNLNEDNSSFNQSIFQYINQMFENIKEESVAYPYTQKGYKVDIKCCDFISSISSNTLEKKLMSLDEIG